MNNFCKKCGSFSDFLDYLGNCDICGSDEATCSDETLEDTKE